MNTQLQSATPSAAIHRGPHPGMLAILYMVLFCAGLYPVTLFYKLPYWPGPWEPASVVIPYFHTQGGRVLACMFLQLGAFICLGLFTASVVSRLHFLGARATGVYIALFGGFLVVFDAFVGTMAMWTIIHPAFIGHPAAGSDAVLRTADAYAGAVDRYLAAIRHVGTGDSADDLRAPRADQSG